MPIPSHVTLGPLTVEMCHASVLHGVDDFPADQAWADETETLLLFLKSEGQLERYTPRLRAKERTATMAEVRAAYFFNLLGFCITEWEPEAVPGIPGDLEVTLPHELPLFVEVKCPGWQGEVDSNDRAMRKRQPKYLNGAGGAVDPMERVAYSVSKAIPKLDSSRMNLVVAVDDLFTSPLDWPVDNMRSELERALSSGSEFSAVSVVLILNPVAYVGRPLEYRSMLIHGPGVTLSAAIAAALDRRGASVLPLDSARGT